MITPMSTLTMHPIVSHFWKFPQTQVNFIFPGNFWAQLSCPDSPITPRKTFWNWQILQLIDLQAKFRESWLKLSIAVILKLNSEKKIKSEKVLWAVANEAGAFQNLTIPRLHCVCLLTEWGVSGVEFSPEPVFLRCYSTDAQIHEYKGTNTNGLSMKCRQTNKFRDLVPQHKYHFKELAR